MEGRRDEIQVPRGVLAAAGAMCVFVFAVAALHEPGAPEAAGTEEGRRLVFEEAPGGGLVVRDAAGRPLERLEIEGDSFAITAARGVAGRVGAGDGPPRFALELRPVGGGRVALEDPETGRRLVVAGFGPVSEAAVARWLTAE
jgi:hypothetical protein